MLSLATSNYTLPSNLAASRHGIMLPSIGLISVRNAPSAIKKTKLKNVEEYKNWNAKVFTFKIQCQPINLTTFHDTPAKNIALAKDSVFQILREALDYVAEQNFNFHSIIHLYLKVTGLDSDFVVNPSGDDALRVHHLTSDAEILKIVDKFAAIIQSGKPAILDNSATLKVYVFQPPNDVPEANRWIRFLGDGYRNGNHSGFGDQYRGVVMGATIKEYLDASRCVVTIRNEDKLCMARAIVVGMAYLKDPNSNESKNIRKADSPKLKKQRNAALKLCEDCKVDHTHSMGQAEAEIFAAHLKININVFSYNYGAVEVCYYTRIIEGAPAIHLHFDYERKHYDFISKINGFLSGIIDHAKFFCESCKQIKSREDHICSMDKCFKPYMIGDKVLYHYYDDALLEETTDIVKENYIQKYTKEPEMVPNSKVWYFDTETYWMKIDKETGLEIDESKDGWDIEPRFYRPQPYNPINLNDERYWYKQKVNWVEIQNHDGSITNTFSDIETFMNFLRTDQMKDTILVAHYGGGFDFHLLYEAMFQQSSMIQGELKNPLMNGVKFKKGYLFNGIQLVDSYNYLSQPLAELPKTFDFEELEKGYFPHYFNLPKHYEYVGPIPDKEYYGYLEWPQKKMEAFVEWHNKKVAERYIFNFREEMEKYCHSDVTILRIAFQKFREIFCNLTHVDDENLGLGDDPLNFITIASLSYDGVFRRHFMPENSIQYVKRPGRDQYSYSSILWMQHLMQKEGIFIQHALNGGEQVFAINVGSRHYSKKVDGYCPTSNTVYEFHGCFYHGCRYCYDENEICTLKTDTKDKTSKKVRYGNLYATTIKHEQDLKDMGFNLVSIWECQFKKLKKQENIGNDLDLERILPLNPRHAYFGGRTNAVKLYYECKGSQKIHYIDVTSMYPTVMGLEQYSYPLGEPKVHRHDDPDFPIMNLSDLFGLQKCRVRPPNDLYHPVLPERNKDGKVCFHLNKMIGTWTHVELQKAVSLGYVIEEVYEQHHFHHHTNTLFSGYVNTFFAMKQKAEAEGNKGLKQVAKLCLNSFYGKFGFNIEKQHQTKVVRSLQQLWSLMNSCYTRCSTNIINDGVAIASYNAYDEYTEHEKSNVYIAAFVTTYARLKLYEALEFLNDKVLYFDTDSVVYVSPTGDHLIDISVDGHLGGWTSEAKQPDDYFTHFVSAGPKTYALKSKSGKQDICKAKGFTLSVSNHAILNFESLKVQVLHKAFGGAFKCPDFVQERTKRRKVDLSTEEGFEDIWGEDDMDKLVLHADESIMRRQKNFQIHVEKNRGKALNMIYDKRYIMVPIESIQDVSCVNTLPFGHEDIEYCEIDLP
jgi:G:T-mismatch repair DNA endonuclease (very short patch repair protein)